MRSCRDCTLAGAAPPDPGWPGPLVEPVRPFGATDPLSRRCASRVRGPENPRTSLIRLKPLPAGSYAAAPGGLVSSRFGRIAARPALSGPYGGAPAPTGHPGRDVAPRPGRRQPARFGPPGGGRRQAPDTPRRGAWRRPSPGTRPGLSRSTERAGKGRRPHSGGVGASAAFPDERKGLETADPDPSPATRSRPGARRPGGRRRPTGGAWSSGSARGRGARATAGGTAAGGSRAGPRGVGGGRAWPSGRAGGRPGGARCRRGPRLTTSGSWPPRRVSRGHRAGRTVDFGHHGQPPECDNPPKSNPGRSGGCPRRGPSHPSGSTGAGIRGSGPGA
jgi:hypothetical protein